MRVLLTALAYERFWERLARPEVEALIMEKDGALRTGAGVPVETRDANPEIAWGTQDLFHHGAQWHAFIGLVQGLASLRWFQSPAAGFDSPVFSAVAANGARVTNTHVNGIPIAEFVMRSVLDHFQQADRWRAAARERRWAVHDWREVSATTWLVIGLGSIGGGVARRAQAFGATVIGCRRNPSASDPADRTVTLSEVPAVLSEADVVVLSVPASDDTDRLVDEGFLKAMKPGSLLVNVARGSLVDEDALLAALDRGVPEAAILDVFSTEPLPPDHPIWDHPAVTVTPHNSAGGTGRYARHADLFGRNLDLYLSGCPLLNDVTELVTK